MRPWFCSKGPCDEGDVGFVDGALAEGFAEPGVGGVVFGDEDDAGGFLVEAMNDAGAKGVAGLRERLAAAEEGVDERAGGVAGAGVDGHAGGLVDGDDVVVFVENVERNGFGFGAERRARLRIDGDFFAAVEAVRAFGGLAVDEDEAAVDEFFHAGAAEIGTVGGDDAVEAVAGFVSGDFEGWKEFSVLESRRDSFRAVFSRPWLRSGALACGAAACFAGAEEESRMTRWRRW